MLLHVRRLSEALRCLQLSLLVAGCTATIGTTPLPEMKETDPVMEPPIAPPDMPDLPDMPVMPSAVPDCAMDLNPYLSSLNVPGISAAALKDGRLICLKTASVEGFYPVQRDTIFHWASVSKSVTTVAAMMLVEQGLLSLDADINDALPFTVTNPHCSDAPITLRGLLTHRSSIIDGDAYDDSYVSGSQQVEPLSSFLRSYLTREGRHYDEDDNFDTDCPGDYEEYSNVAFGTIGLMIEHVTSMSFQDFVQQRIFGPLGMGESSFRLADLDPSRIATPYDNESGFVPTEWGHVQFPTAPDGLLRSSVPHMARFLGMLMQGGAFEGQTILSPASMAQITTEHYVDEDDPTVRQGLGLFMDGELTGHDGDDPGASALMFYRDDGTGALLVANGSFFPDDNDAPTDAAFEALQALMDEAALNP